MTAMLCAKFEKDLSTKMNATVKQVFAKFEHDMDFRQIVYILLRVLDYNWAVA